MSSTTYLSDRQIAQRLGVSRATVWRWANQREFPQPVRLGPATTRWKLADVQKWERARAAA